MQCSGPFHLVKFPRKTKGRENVLLSMAHANESDLRSIAASCRKGLGGWSSITSGAANTVKFWRMVRDTARRCPAAECRAAWRAV